MTLHPTGNKHFSNVIPQYRTYLAERHSADVIGATFEDYIASIPDADELRPWKQYLSDRYLVG
jgi:hypothetical protein